ncbi:MAG: PAS domain-containing protein [Actinomycetota bacterium]
MSSDWPLDDLHPEAYRSLVEGVPAILYIDRPDEASTNLYTSPQVEDLMGFTVSEWTSDPDLWRTQLHAEDAEATIAAHRISNQRGERFLAEYRMITKDKRTVWIRDEASPVRDADGTLLYWRGVMLDITDRKEAEDEARRARERLQALVDAIPAVIYVETPDASPDGFFLSGYVETLFGYTVEQWTWTPDFWLDRLHPDDRYLVEEEDEGSDRTRDRYVSEYRFRAADGRWVWLHDEAVFVPSVEGDGFWQGFMFDITEQKESEERLRWSLDALRTTLQQRRELARRLEQAQEAERRRIAADIHDDQIQVMSAVDVRLQMLAGASNVAASDLLTVQADVREAIERLRSLTFELRPSTLDREGLGPALRLYLEHTAKATGWNVDVQDRLEVEPERDLRAVIYRIGQEAVQNARKHAGAASVKIAIEPRDDGVALVVMDDGSGFAPDPAATPEPGHLGLSTLVERAELAGGWARITSAPGAGTTVECWLPLDPGGDAGLRA